MVELVLDGRQLTQALESRPCLFPAPRLVLSYQQFPLALVGVFTTQKLANAENQSWLLTIYQPVYHALKTLPNPVLSHPSPESFRQPGTPPGDSHHCASVSVSVKCSCY